MPEDYYTGGFIDNEIIEKIIKNLKSNEGIFLSKKIVEQLQKNMDDNKKGILNQMNQLNFNELYFIYLRLCDFIDLNKNNLNAKYAIGKSEEIISKIQRILDEKAEGRISNFKREYECVFIGKTEINS